MTHEADTAVVGAVISQVVGAMKNVLRLFLLLELMLGHEWNAVLAS